MSKLRVGLYGVYGHQIREKVYNNADTELAALCCVPEFYAQEAQDKCENEVKIYYSLDEMLKDDTIDLISLCSEKRGDQAADAIACLKAGKHVYAEKPATFSEKELDEILKIAKENNCEFHEMADTIFNEPYWSAHKLVLDGKIGEVVQAYIQKSYPLNLHIRPQDEYIDGGQIRQVGIHAVRYLEHMTGLKVEKASVYQTHLGNSDSNNGLITASSWAMTLSNGGVASICVNYLNPAGYPIRGNESVRLFGTKGMLEITDAATKSHIYTQEGDEGEVNISMSTCRDFFDLLVEHLLYGKAMPMSLEDELHPLRVVIRAAEAAETTEVKA